MKVVKYRVEATEDVEAAIRYYQSQDSTVGERFAEAVIRQVDRISEDCEIGFPSAAGTRTQPVPGFPYGIVFKDYGVSVLIVAVYHWSRRPEAWSERLG